MKKILLAITLLISINAIGQADSIKIKTSLSLQVRDWLFFNSYIRNSEYFENVYDSMKVKVGAVNSPTMTTVIKVDSVKQGQIIKLAQILKEGEYSTVTIPYTRINNALKSNAYLTAKIDAMDAMYILIYNARIQFELDKLKAVILNQ